MWIEGEEVGQHHTTLAAPVVLVLVVGWELWRAVVNSDGGSSDVRANALILLTTAIYSTSPLGGEVAGAVGTCKNVIIAPRY